MEKLTPGLLGLGGRRLAGTCEVCGDAVCQTCMSTQVLEAGVFRKRVGVPGQEHRKVKGRVCRSCLWELLTERGERPPFPAPPGQRERAARAARESCTHPDVKPWMGFCPDCGDEVAWKAEHGNPACEACGAPSHRFFNCCWACGESFDEENPPQTVARGYRLEFDCDSDDCTGKVAWLMPHCPWCGAEKHWQHPGNGGLECVACESSLDRAWAFCVRCGEEAPLPDDCPRCGLELEEAQSAARCEQCRNIVCGDCFDLRVVPAESGEQHERLLCSTCGGAFAPAPEAPEPQAAADEEQRDEPEEEPEDEPEDEPEEEEAPREPAASREPPPPSPWEVLGVSRDTPLPEVKRAYLALVAQYHPDKVAQLGPKLQALAQEETRRIIEAWEQVRRQSR
ncbi:J domain-containing protein [Myxococcus sp. RHST-1-4]|nr:J domain-containing protein [Myxococcus sp. RHSTA-1-4]